MIIYFNILGNINEIPLNIRIVFVKSKGKIPGPPIAYILNE